MDTSAPHDGASYRFHLTIEMGKIGAVDPYKEYYDQIADKVVDLMFVAKEMALFYYSDGEIKPGSFICYRVLPLGKGGAS